MVLGDLLTKHAKENPAAEAIVFREIRLNYGTFNRETDRIAAGLLKMGVARGDRVGIYLSSRPEFLFIYLAAAKIGAIAVPVSWEELKTIPSASVFKLKDMHARLNERDPWADYAKSAVSITKATRSKLGLG